MKAITIRIPVRVELLGDGGGVTEVTIEQVNYPDFPGVFWRAPSSQWRSVQQSMSAVAGDEAALLGIWQPPSIVELDLDRLGRLYEWEKRLERMMLFPNEYPRSRPYMCIYCRRQTYCWRRDCPMCGYRGGDKYPSLEVQMYGCTNALGF